ncbi:MAG: hypothetical protein JO326_08235 [Acetobacteraceae bacterium]|nr:hypothetical protein [Acetobacteraceae bacterium]
MRLAWLATPALLAAALLAAALVAGPTAALAQAIDLSQGGPVDVTATGGFEWHQDKQEVVATGDARAVRGNVTVLADRLIAFYRKRVPAAGAAPATPPPPASAPAAASAAGTPGALGEADTGDNEVYRLEATGNVQIFTPTDHATGERAIYDIDQAVLVMTGNNLKITTPQQVLTARDTVEYWSQKHMAVARGNAVIVTTDARRISADTLVGYTEDGTAPQPHPTQVAAAPAAGKPPGDPIEASGKLKLVEAFGNVEVRTVQDIVRGDRGVYVPDTGIARLVGHVRITHGQNQINGPAADVNMKTGIAHLLSSASERVTGVIIPNDATLQGNGAKTPAAASPAPAPAR